MKIPFKKIFNIRIKLVLMSSFLLVIPWIGYQYILSMEEYLQRAQEQTVLGTAQALATALSERPELFNSNNYSRERLEQDLYVYPVFFPLQIDDEHLLDWRDYQQYEKHYQEASASPNPLNQLSSFRQSEFIGDLLSFRLMLGEYNDSLYIYLRVIDENVVLRNRNSLRVNNSDSLRISLVNQQDELENYVIAPYANGFIYPYRVGTDVADIAALEYEPKIVGRWTDTREGYEIELRMPLAMLGSKLGLAVFDVDDNDSRQIDAVVSTSALGRANQLGTLRRPTPEIDRIVAGMGHSNSRVRVVDRSQRVLLSVGDITTANGLALDKTSNNSKSHWNWVRNTFLRPIYQFFVYSPTDNFMDRLFQGGTLEGEHIISALTGNSMTRFRTLDDEETRILEAAYPVVANDLILGAVVVDQNMNGIRTFRNQALETLFNTFIGIILVTIAALFVFASSLSSRIRKIRDQAENTIDSSGRISNTIIASSSSDEIGDLSRSFSSILDRLGQYTHYLENMSSRLSHELRTPVTVVRSSLENLRLTEYNPEAEIYLQRAEEGITRLNLILTNMSEAARLEQILKTSEKEKTDLNKVIQMCMEGYVQVYPQTKFNVELNDESIFILGNADYLVQLMDKLIANAIEFSFPNQPVLITCSAANGEASVSVVNSGPFLAEEMKDRIFDSMVSLRPEGKQKQPHLGIGLHIARMITEFHNGYIYADNLIEKKGVMVVLRIPLIK